MDKDIFYAFNNEKIYLEEMIIFLFYLWKKSKNLAAFILFILIIDSLFSRKLIMTIGICCFTLYLVCYFCVKRKKQAQVKEITDCISRLKKRYRIIDYKTG